MMFEFKKKIENTQHYILGIVLKEDKGKLMVFEAKDQKVFLRAIKEFVYSNAFENLIEDIDQQLSILENEGYTDFSETIYFLNEIFIDEKTKEIRKSFLPKLKEIEEKLSLKALGYASINEVIINQIENENNLPMSAIFLNVDKTYFHFTLRKAGKNIYEKRIARSNDFLFDFYEGLNNVKDYVPLPIRIILFDDEDLANEKNTLIAHQFKGEYFIQAPKIEVISQKLINDYLTNLIEKKLSVSRAEEVKEKKQEELFGFVLGEDIKKSKKVIDAKIEKPAFVSGFSQKNYSFFGQQFKKFFLSFLAPLRAKINNLNFVLIGLILIIIAVFINEYFFHRVKIILTTKKISFQKNINLSETELPLITKEVEKEVNKTIATSGEKIVGEKAKGEVDLYNYTFDQLKLNAGTRIFFNEIKFALNEEVKIASASYIGNQLGNPLEPGKSKAKITAIDIGENGNLPKETLFQIEGISPNQAFGKNEAALTGGNKKTVRIFSKKDKEKIRSFVIEEAKKDDLPPKSFLEKDLVLISDLTHLELVEENYSSQEEDEVDNVTLRAKAKLVYYFYNQENLLKKILEKFKEDIPEDYLLKSKNINLKLKNISQTDNKKNFEFSIKGFYNKKVSINEKKEKLRFLSKKKLSAVLKSDDIEKYMLKEENKFPLFSDYLPIFIKNIEIIEN